MTKNNNKAKTFGYYCVNRLLYQVLVVDFKDGSDDACTQLREPFFSLCREEGHVL